MADKVLVTIERKEFESGDIEFYRNDILHNDNGPAVEKSNGDKYWYQYGILHRSNGPAVDKQNGESEYFINGIQYTEKVYIDTYKYSNPLTINIVGNSNSDRTSLSHYLNKLLSYDGFNCKNTDADVNMEIMINIDKIIKELKDNTDIIINTNVI